MNADVLAIAIVCAVGVGAIVLVIVSFLPTGDPSRAAYVDCLSCRLGEHNRPALRYGVPVLCRCPCHKHTKRSALP